MGNQGFLDQSWWQGVGGLFGILAFIVGVIALFVAIRQNGKKLLSYHVLTSESLLDIDEQVKDSIKIEFHGHQVDQLHIFRIRFINNGNMPITKNDFGGIPISLRLNNCKNIINCMVIQTNPSSLGVEMKFDTDNEVLIEPMLLNPNDSFDLKITFDGVDRKFSLNARIEGISLLKEILENGPPKDIFFSTNTFLSIWIPMTITFITFSIISIIYSIPYSETVITLWGTIAVFILLIKTLTERFTSKARDTFDRRR